MIKINGRRLVLTTLVLAAAIQIVPMRRDNPRVTGPLTAAPADVLSTLRRACYNCHSHETIWPWYSYLAPVSWLVARDVHEGRRHLNFSAWSEYSPTVRLKRLSGISSLVQEHDMPPWFYLPLHAEARLSADDIELLSMWADNSGGAEPAAAK
jgi:hypothetical protein